MVLRYSDRLFEGGSSGWFSVRQLYFPAYPAGSPILPSQVERSIHTAAALSNVFVYYDTGRALEIFPPKVLIIDSIGGTFCINMDRKLANPASSSMTTAQIPRPDKCRSGKSNFLLGIHIFTEVNLSTPFDRRCSSFRYRSGRQGIFERDAILEGSLGAADGQSRIRRMHLRRTGREELGSVSSVPTGHRSPHGYHDRGDLFFFNPLCLSAEHCQLVYLGLTWEEKRTITIFTWLAYFLSRWT